MRTQKLVTAPQIEIAAADVGSGPRRLLPRIKAAPRIRQLYWCDFGCDVILPEMHKERPVVIISFKNTLHGHCLVLPTSTDPQEGESAQWAHKLSLKPDGARDSWVVCNHLYTVSTARLAPLAGKAIPRLNEAEFNQILSKTMAWLPRLP
ncbi:MAG: type II toxin-antitoxin system PemK/MazF family toxin [Amaricoccus sp.]